MASRRATIAMIPTPLAEAMRTTLTLPVQGDGQVAAQQAIIGALGQALEARRQRILISQSAVNPIKWISLLLQAICTLTAIAMVHSDNRTALWLAYGAFALEVFSLYVKTFGTLLDTSLFFLIAAVMVSVLAWAAYKLHQSKGPAEAAA